MIKQISIEGFSHAEVEAILNDGSISCSLLLMNAEEQEIRRENGFSLPANSIEFTEDELKLFFPDQISESGEVTSTIPVFEPIEQVPTLSIEQRLEQTEKATEEIIEVLNEKNIL